MSKKKDALFQQHKISSTDRVIKRFSHNPILHDAHLTGSAQNVLQQRKLVRLGLPAVCISHKTITELHEAVWNVNFDKLLKLRE